MTESYRNPVYDGYFADPFVFSHDGEYFAIGTGESDASGDVPATGEAAVFPLLRSRDLAVWEPLGRAMVRPEAELGDTFWAPEIAYQGGTFYLYYSVGFGDTRHQLRVATSSSPAGPYVDAGIALTRPEHCPFAIDPHPFRDADGRWYLFHARDFLDAEGEARAGTALVASELVDMTRLSERVTTVLRPRFDWQRFLADRLMYGRRFDWHTLEGPNVLFHDGRYYCFYSGGRWESAGYGVDYALASSVLGPYSDAGAEGGPRVLAGVPGSVLGPGHNSLVVGPNGRTRYFAYHAWDGTMSARRLCIDPLIWTPDGPRCRGPSSDTRRFE